MSVSKHAKLYVVCRLRPTLSVLSSLKKEGLLSLYLYIRIQRLMEIWNPHAKSFHLIPICWESYILSLKGYSVHSLSTNEKAKIILSLEAEEEMLHVSDFQMQKSSSELLEIKIVISQ